MCRNQVVVKVFQSLRQTGGSWVRGHLFSHSWGWNRAVSPRRASCMRDQWPDSSWCRAMQDFDRHMNIYNLAIPSVCRCLTDLPLVDFDIHRRLCTQGSQYCFDGGVGNTLPHTVWPLTLCSIGKRMYWLNLMMHFTYLKKRSAIERIIIGFSIALSSPESPLANWLHNLMIILHI